MEIGKEYGDAQELKTVLIMPLYFLAVEPGVRFPPIM